MRHPLAGADPATLIAAVRQGGAPDRIGRAAPVGLAALARAPFGLVERVAAAPFLPRIDDIAPPVFILGHWRSGTTHLYNALALGDFGTPSPVDVGLPWDMQGLAALLRPMLERMVPEGRWIDSVPVTPLSPQEDEIALGSMTALSFLHAIYFPRRFDALLDRALFRDGASAREIAEREARIVLFARKLARRTGKRLLIKNPAHTAQLPMLRRLFPGARIVHIHRDPIDVFLSMRTFYAKMLDALALQTVPPDLDVDGAILRVYDRMMRAWVAAAEAAAPGEIVEIAYAEVARDPMGALDRIDAALGLGLTDAARERQRAYFDAVAGHRAGGHARDAGALDRARAALAPWIARYGETEAA